MSDDLDTSRGIFKALALSVVFFWLPLAAALALARLMGSF